MKIYEKTIQTVAGPRKLVLFPLFVSSFIMSTKYLLQLCSYELILLDFNSCSAITKGEVVRELICLTTGYFSSLHCISVYLLRHRSISHLSCTSLLLDLDCTPLFSFHGMQMKGHGSRCLSLALRCYQGTTEKWYKVLQSSAVSMSPTFELHVLSKVLAG